MPLESMFWGDLFGSFVDKFGIWWMIDHAMEKQGWGDVLYPAGREL